MNIKQRALLGAILGDAVGVPYEFKDAMELPDRKLIDMTPPRIDMQGRPLSRTYGMPDGTWSDDSSLLLCLLEALQENSTDNAAWARAFARKAIDWRLNGYFAIGGRIFDIGNQTAHALTELEHGADPLTRSDDDWASGNGSLMRGLAPALVATSEEHAATLGKLHSIATHATGDCIATCKVYASLAYRMLQGIPFDTALPQAMIYANGKLHAKAIHGDMGGPRPSGSGYVIESFWSAIWAVRQGTDFKSVIQHAISLGNDTDTTACIAGGLAGIMYELPEEWLAKLRGREMLKGVLEKL